MKNHISIINNNQGLVFLASVLLLGVLLILGTTGYLMTTGEHHVARNYTTSKMSYFDASAGVHFARFQIEKGLKDGTLSLPVDATPVAIPNPLGNPSGYNFTLSPITKLIGGNFYQYTNTGYSHAGNLSVYASSTTELTVKFRKIPTEAYAAFAYENYRGVNGMGIYAYEQNGGPYPFGPNPYDGILKDDPFTTGAGSYQEYRDSKVGLAGVGSNVEVDLKNATTIDGFVYLGEVAGTDANFIDHGATYYGVEYLNEEIPRDPKDITGNFDDPWDNHTNFLVTTYDEICDYIIDEVNNNGGNEIIILDSSDTEIANDAILEPDTSMKDGDPIDGTYDFNDGDKYVLHSQGVSGGFYYFDTLENKFMDDTVIVIDARDGDVNIVIEGDLFIKKGDIKIINEDGDGDVDTNYAVNIYLRGNSSTFEMAVTSDYIYEDDSYGSTLYANPLNFKINSNNTTDSETIYAGTSGHFIGSIYAPYTDVQIHTKGDLYGAIWADEIIMGNTAAHFFPTELADDALGNEILFYSWKDDRFEDY